MMSRLRIVNWPMRSWGEKAEAPRSTRSRPASGAEDDEDHVLLTRRFSLFVSASGVGLGHWFGFTTYPSYCWQSIIMFMLELVVRFSMDILA